MRQRTKDWPRLNVSLSPEVMRQLDKRVAIVRKKEPGSIVTRLELIRAAVDKWLADGFEF